MREGSSELLKAYETSAKFYQTAHFALANGQTLDLGKGDFYLSGNGLSDSAGSSTFPLGVALEKQITLSIVNDKDQYSTYDFIGARITVYCKYDLPERVESFLFGTFTVRDPETYGTVITITAVDDMYKGDEDYSTKLSYPMTAGEALRDSCSTCNITLVDTVFANSDYVIKEAPTGLTHRSFWGLCAMLAGGNARVDEYNRLRIITYDFSTFETDQGLYGGVFDNSTPYATGDTADGGTFKPWTTGYTYDGGNFHNWSGIHQLFKVKNLKVSTDDVVITGIQSEVDETTYTSGQEGYMLKVDNQLITGNEQDAVNRIGQLLIGLKFRPFEMDHVAYPFAEFGDLCYVTDRKNNVYQSVITDVDFQFYGYTTIKCTAESPIRNSSNYYSETTKAVIKARRETKIQLDEYDKAVQMLTSLITQSFGVHKTEEVLEDGSTIFYLHNKPTLAASRTIWKMTANAFAVSTDGGKTWNAGMDSSGNAVVNVLSAIGINFDWARGGTLTLGGKSNTNGLLKLLNASGVEVGRMDNNGINILKGLIKIGLFSVGTDGKVVANDLTSNSANITGGKIGGWKIEQNDLSNESGDCMVVVANGSNDNKDFLVVRVKKNGSYAYPFWVRANGQVGINLIDQSTDTPAITIGNTDGGYMQMGADGFEVNFGSHYAKLYYNANGWARLTLGNNGVEKARIDSDGMIQTRYGIKGSATPNVHINSQGVILECKSSSRRYKRDESEDLTDMDPERLYQIPVKTYYYKDGYISAEDPRCGEKFLGFVVEDFESVYPWAIDYDDQGRPEMWNSNILIPAIMKLIQNQHEEIESLKKDITEIKEMLKGAVG